MRMQSPFGEQEKSCDESDESETGVGGPPVCSAMKQARILLHERELWYYERDI